MRMAVAGRSRAGGPTSDALQPTVVDAYEPPPVQHPH